MNQERSNASRFGLRDPKNPGEVTGDPCGESAWTDEDGVGQVKRQRRYRLSGD